MRRSVQVRTSIKNMSREKLNQVHSFLRISLRTEKGGSPPDTPTQLKGLIVQALQTLHGQVGAAIPVDVLQHSTEDEDSPDGFTLTSAILRVPQREVVKVWSALTLCAGPGTVCTVDKASSSLLSLAVDSRSFRFCK